MAKRARRAPFGEWLDANNYPPARYAEIAKQLKCSTGSVRNYATGRVPPRRGMLRKLVALTGLPALVFVDPFGKVA